jgi:glycosyltransferase involved in cell wall biosynthesis
MEKFDVSVILPIKSSQTLNFKEYFEKAIKSLTEQKTQINELVIVHTDETSLVEYLETYDFSTLNVVKSVWTKTPNFSEQINHGVSISSSNWISLFEFDDEYSNIWFKNAKKYSEVYPEVDAFLPVVVDTDDAGKFVGFTNEATFALNITSEMGILSNEVLQDFQNFQTAGMVIKKKSFVDFGSFKPSFKLTFGYELFLRLTHNSLKIMSIPKIGYKHTNLREGSLFWNYRNGEEKLSQDEAKFWIDSAKKEYFFIQDRQIKFEPQTI